VEEILRRLGLRIREIRIQRGFKSQEEFADYCKLHRTFIGHLETGRKDFRLTTVIRVTEALGITLEEIFAGLESGKPLKTTRRRIRGSDLDAVAREVSALERGIQRLKKYTSPDGREITGDKSGTSKRGSRKRTLAKRRNDREPD
jgi:transcriptional regulator with XRE-family HTH domain